jgi:CspA family cold shock protein
MTEQESGTIKSFKAAKGFGFIERQGGKDVFFHVSAIQSGEPATLREGQAVKFNVEQGPKGPRAVNIVVIE